MIFDPDAPQHHAWLARESDRLIDFFAMGEVDEHLRFCWRDDLGATVPERPRYLYNVSRLVHCLSVEHMLGRKDAGIWAQEGVELLLARFLDPVDGGFFAAIGDGDEVVSTRKETYGHAFVMLAGNSASMAGVAGGAELFEEARRCIDEHLWDADAQAALESFERDWTSPEAYRGQNANMHLTEAYLAAYERTGEEVFAERAESIARRLILEGAEGEHWRIPEHYTSSWMVDREYGANHPDDPFRPYGTLTGHALEWSRLLLQLRSLRPAAEWARDAAIRLFDRAVADGWDDERGGFVYSVDFEGAVVNPARMHWTIAEAIGAALWLYRATGAVEYREWYVRFWAYAEQHVLDRKHGSWRHELDDLNRPTAVTWDGKPDLYHAWQATLYARISGDAGVARAARDGLVLAPTDPASGEAF